MNTQGNLKVFYPELSLQGQRVDLFLKAQYPDLSRTRLKDLIIKGCLDINGEVLRDPSYGIKAQDVLTLRVPLPEVSVLAPCVMSLDILFEDEHLLVLNKPAHLCVHPGAGQRNNTLVNALIAHCGSSLSGVGGVLRPGIVHRLDKDTTGLLVVAKDDQTHQALSQQFASHGRDQRLERQYVALAWGKMPRPQGTVEAPLARDPKNRLKISVSRGIRGKVALTNYSVLDEYLGHDKKTVVASLLSCQLMTGRTHQIRVHMAHIGHPLMGDPLYAAGFRTSENRLSPAAKDALSLLKRQALHAQCLGFEHPITQEAMRFEVPPPKDFSDLLEALQE